MTEHPAELPTPFLPLLLTRPQLAAYLQCSIRHVDNLTRRGLLPVVRLGGWVRYRRDSVLRAITRLERGGFG
jgi:excisionase family DNA binding protein